MRFLFVSLELEEIGPQYISAFLKSRGHQTDLALDQSFHEAYLMDWPWIVKKYNFNKILLDKIRSFKPDLIGVSTLSDHFQRACDLAKHVKENFDIPIVFGGTHATLVPQKVIENDFVDYLIVGEAEHAVADLLENLDDLEKLSKTPNLWFMKNGKVVHNPVRPLVKDLDELPFADKELYFQYAPYLKNYYRVISSRGCPNRCTYCCSPALREHYKTAGHPFKVRKRSVGNLMEELQASYEKYNYRYLMFGDDDFLNKRAWIQEFAENYGKKIRVPFKALAHPTSIHEGTGQLLRKAGCDIIEIGVQTTSQHVREQVIRRFETNDDIRFAAKELKKAGIKLEVDHIFGLPGDTEETNLESVVFYNEIRPEILNTFWLRPYPGTVIIQQLQDAGMMGPDGADKIEKGEGLSIVSGGFMQTQKPFLRARFIMALIPLFSRSTIQFILDKDLFKRIVPGHFFVMLTRIYLSLFRDKYRLYPRLGRYYYFLKILLKRAKH